MRRRHNPYIHPHPLQRTDRPELTLLQHAQQLHLHLERQIPNLIEERRPPFASSSSPRFASPAPVNAPFVCPKSSLSISGPTSDPQSIGTKWPRVALSNNSPAPATSFPVPLSP